MFHQIRRILRVCLIGLKTFLLVFLIDDILKLGIIMGVHQHFRISITRSQQVAIGYSKCFIELLLQVFAKLVIGKCDFFLIQFLQVFLQVYFICFVDLFLFWAPVTAVQLRTWKDMITH